MPGFGLKKKKWKFRRIIIMNENMSLILSMGAGLIMGAFFFGGLWWTVRRGLDSTVPAIWFISSGLIRFIIVIAGFYFVGLGSWKRMICCLLGFFIARLICFQLPQVRKFI
jgi:F1F0 ATPase subunit 2